ncbi:MAG: hypothetical protein HC828_01240 [Blastochloris sp.]|nr:hypothetical protein [Blastochloris sp.]
MNGVNQNQQQALDDIANSMDTTFLGRAWPDEYSDFSSRWGYFNSIYNVLYPRQQSEWYQIAQFSIDTRFVAIWHSAIANSEPVRQLAKLACVGNGRSRFMPHPDVQIAHHVLRSISNVNTQLICQNDNKCRSRLARGITTCQATPWGTIQQNANTPNLAHHTPLGATLRIIYQIRNNLFHGSKQEVTGPDFARNLDLVRSSADIMETLLLEIRRLI